MLKFIDKGSLHNALCCQDFGQSDGSANLIKSFDIDKWFENEIKRSTHANAYVDVNLSENSTAINKLLVGWFFSAKTAQGWQLPPLRL